MPMILQTKHFIVQGHDKPHHDRNNGGHARVSPIERFADRTEMPMDLYLLLMQLVRLAGEAITTVMRRKGVDVVRINYQDNGNWTYFPSMAREPHLHIHLYVRSNGEKHPSGDPRFRAFPDALFFPFSGDNPEYYADFKPYSDTDCTDIREEMQQLVNIPTYQGLKEELAIY